MLEVSIKKLLWKQEPEFMINWRIIQMEFHDTFVVFKAQRKENTQLVSQIPTAAFNGMHAFLGFSWTEQWSPPVHH